MLPIENLNGLRAVLHAARTGSLTGAAQALDMTAAGASAALERVEAQLGIRLFERCTRVMRLTDPGRTLIDHASRTFDQLAEGEAQLSAGHAVF